MKLRFMTYLSVIIMLIISVGGCPQTAIAKGKTAKVYILRKQTIGTHEKPEISVNGIMAGQLPNKNYIECTVPIGNVTISMTFPKHEGISELKIKATSGGEYFVKASIDNSGVSLKKSFKKAVEESFKSSCKLEVISNQEGGKLLRGCKDGVVADITNPASINNSKDYAQEKPQLTKPKAKQQNNPQPQSQPQAQVQPQVTQQMQSVSPAPVEQKVSRRSDVDINIPKTKAQNSNTFVLIIANEDYAFVDNVEFALNDGNTFKEYCTKTLGIPERQIWLYENASLGIISSGVNKLVRAMNTFEGGKAIIYYCGHGIPDEKTGDAYIVPVDGSGTDVTSCYSLNRLYKTMAEANASNVTYFMDACFTGAKRDGSMLVAARGVAREPKKEVVEGNTIVFSAASGDETAMPFREKQHGLFTYFLLKKLQETKGNVTYGDLAKYINDNVKREAFLTNDKPQNPVVATSESLASEWKNVKIK